VASAVRNHRGIWLARWKCSPGKWQTLRATPNTRRAALELANELEQRARRQALGLDPLPPKDGGGTLGELLSWWLETYSSRSASHERNHYTVRKHLLASELAQVRLVDLTSGSSRSSAGQDGRLRGAVRQPSPAVRADRLQLRPSRDAGLARIRLRACDSGASLVGHSTLGPRRCLGS
jgi:hypothetical protein